MSRLEIDTNGNRFWYNDKRHRIDGPAIECSNGVKWWYKNSKQYTEKEYRKICSK